MLIRAILNEAPEMSLQDSISVIAEHLYAVMAAVRRRDKHPSHYCFPCAYITAKTLETAGFSAQTTLTSFSVDCQARGQGMIDGLELCAREQSWDGHMAGHVYVVIDTPNGPLYFDPSAPQFYRDRTGMRLLTAMLVFDQTQFAYYSDDGAFRFVFNYQPESLFTQTGAMAQMLASNDHYRTEIAQLSALLTTTL